MVAGSPTLRVLIGRAADAGMRIHVMPEGALPDGAAAVLTIVEGNSATSDVVVRLDVSAAGSRLAGTLEHEIGHALAAAGRQLPASEVAMPGVFTVPELLASGPAAGADAP